MYRFATDSKSGDMNSDGFRGMRHVAKP
ncbi:hypothetical protein [Paraburkholderia lacunae]|uniref:Uncharacterized protein n=1 Tax=Paraburkholderia lacunae TaxID=2211104 RepID=A0A370ND72_9BURK|nr:hypothetical protein DLM46_08310 [Paraburkholderia lacunae]